MFIYMLWVKRVIDFAWTKAEQHGWKHVLVWGLLSDAEETGALFLILAPATCITLDTLLTSLIPNFFLYIMGITHYLLF
jgi:hypothetical protein